MKPKQLSDYPHYFDIVRNELRTGFLWPVMNHFQIDHRDFNEEFIDGTLKSSLTAGGISLSASVFVGPRLEKMDLPEPMKLGIIELKKRNWLSALSVFKNKYADQIIGIPDEELTEEGLTKIRKKGLAKKLARYYEINSQDPDLDRISFTIEAFLTPEESSDGFRTMHVIMDVECGLEMFPSIPKPKWFIDRSFKFANEETLKLFLKTLLNAYLKSLNVV